jgi:phosphoglycerate dehydrogenase-like enzyme
MKPTAIFYNLGRGDTVDQAALIAALSTNRLRAAYLDVTNPEPPPPDSPLWHLPNCHITPHTAGGHADEFQRLAAHFLANLRRYDEGQKLLDQVI